MGGWNGSSGASSASAPKRAAAPSGKKPAWLKGLVALIIIVVLGGAVAWWLMPGDAPVVKEKASKPGAITEVMPAPAASKTQTGDAAKVAPAAEGETTSAAQTNAAPRKLKLWEKGIRVPKAKAAPPKRFKYDAEEDIAFFLETEPGETIFGEIPFDQRFIDRLKESFKEPVEIKPDDTPEMKDLKKAIQETKEDLEKRMEAGEDIAKLFSDSRHQLMELGNYRRDTIDDLMEIAKETGSSREEFDQFVEAVNKKLEDKGVKPFTPTPMTYKMLELNAKKRNLQK